MKNGNHTLQEVAQLQVALNAQSQTANFASDQLRKLEHSLFLVDKKMASHVDSLQNAKEAFALQSEMDQER